MTKSATPNGRRIFLSYARGDDKTFVGNLHERLEKKGFDVWWDMADMPARGLTFLDEIRRAIQAADRVLVVIGPDAIASEYVRAEWQCALAEGKVVVPLLRRGTFETLPPELSPLNCLNHLEERDAEVAFCELLEKLRAPLPTAGALHGGVPDMPPRYRPRPSDFSAIARSVLADLEAPVEIAAGQRAVVLHGMGGVGKSVLAAAFARSTSTRRAFDHGVYWVRAAPDPLETFRRLASLLGVSLAQTPDVDILSSQVRDALDGRRVLIVLDNAPDVVPLEPILRVLAVRTRVLVTSRNAELASLAGAHAVELRELADDQALQLLADWAGADPGALPSEARAVAERCGGLPLALALNGAVAASTPWSDVLEALEEADLAFAERRIADYEHRTVAAALHTSISALARRDPTAPARYRELVIFRSNGGIPEQAVTALWSRTGGLKQRDGRKLIATFARSALVRLDGVAPARRLVLHDLLQLQLRAMDTPTRPLHAALVDAYRKASPGDWTTAQPDGYLHRHLVEHLLKANQAEEAYALCLDPAWFAAVQRAEKAAAADSFLASLDLVLESARTAGDLSTLAQACVVAARFAETAPPEVVAVFAEAGQARRAERIAAATVFALDRCYAFSLLAERAETEERRQRFLAEARRCLESIDHTQRSMALYWICRALAKTGADAAARGIADEAWVNAQELDSDDRWNIPNAQLWAAKAFRLLGDEAGLAKVRESAEVFGRNLDLQIAGVCANVDALRRIPPDRLYPSLVRRGNLALACAEAGLDQKCDELFEGCREEEPDSMRRFAWALALVGRFPDALELIRGMTHAVEQAKAVRRVMYIAATCRVEASEVAATAELAQTLAARAHEAQDDAWRIRAHLARALARAGRLDAACTLAEKICEDAIAPTEANTLRYPERLRAGDLGASAYGKTGPRPLDTKVEPLPDEVAAERVVELARAGDLDAAQAELQQIRVPGPRVQALLAIVRHEPMADAAEERWIEALLTARKVGRRKLNEALAAARAESTADLAETIEKLDARWR